MYRNNAQMTMSCLCNFMKNMPGICAMMLLLLPSIGQATDANDGLPILHEENYNHFRINNLGFITRYPLYLIADSDAYDIENEHGDIIFGFGDGADDGNPRGATERMRLTQGGRLGIGTSEPSAMLDIRGHGSSIEAIRMGVAGDDPTVDHRAIIFEPFGEANTLGMNLGFSFANRAGGGDSASSGSGSFMEFYRDLSTGRSSLGIGVDDAVEALEINGAMRIMNTADAQTVRAGTIRYADGAFEGYDGSQWLNFSGGMGSNNIRLYRGKSLVFGITDEHRTVDNYIINSKDVPRDNLTEFPIPSDGSSYNNDDTGTSGGISIITDRLPRFTVKGNGNTYVHKRLSIGIGAHVAGTVLTVAGAVHVGPDNLQPTTFSYTDETEDYLLWVEKGIVSEDFAIAGVDNWSDHVLQDDYDLKPLEEVEAFISEKGHLPGVPSAQEVKDSGYTVHAMTRTLLEKVEELTLHTIAQEKALQDQRAEIAALRDQLGNMQTHAAPVKTSF